MRATSSRMCCSWFRSKSPMLFSRHSTRSCPEPQLDSRASLPFVGVTCNLRPPAVVGLWWSFGASRSWFPAVSWRRCPWAPNGSGAAPDGQSGGPPRRSLRPKSSRKGAARMGKSMPMFPAAARGAPEGPPERLRRSSISSGFALRVPLVVRMDLSSLRGPAWMQGAPRTMADPDFPPGS